MLLVRSKEKQAQQKAKLLQKPPQKTKIISLTFFLFF